MTYNVSPNHTNTFDLKRPTLCNLLSLNYQINSSRLKSGQAWSLKMALLCRTTAVPWINITLRRGTKINKCRNHCVETSPTVYWGKVHLFTPYLFRSCINHKLQKVVLLSHKFTKSVMFCAVSLVCFIVCFHLKYSNEKKVNFKSKCHKIFISVLLSYKLNINFNKISILLYYLVLSMLESGLNVLKYESLASKKHSLKGGHVRTSNKVVFTHP